MAPSAVIPRPTQPFPVPEPDFDDRALDLLSGCPECGCPDYDGRTCDNCLGDPSDLPTEKAVLYGTILGYLKAESKSNP